MRISGKSTAAITEDGNTFAPILAGITQVEGITLNGLRLYIDLVACLPKKAQKADGDQVHTSRYEGLVHLLQDRCETKWVPQRLSEAVANLSKLGLITLKGGDSLRTAKEVVINNDAIPVVRVYTERKNTIPADTAKREEPQPKPAKREEPKPALTASEAPAINATPLQVIEDIEHQMEPEHVHADKKPMHHTPARQQFFEDPYDALPRSTGDSFAAWEARQRAEMNEFKRSTQEPESPAQEEPAEPAATESVAVKVRRMADADPTFGMSFLERIRYEKEQDRIKAAEQKEQPEENPFISLFRLGDTDQDDQQDDGGSDAWGNDSSEVDDDEMW